MIYNMFGGMLNLIQPLWPDGLTDNGENIMPPLSHLPTVGIEIKITTFGVSKRTF